MRAPGSRGILKMLQSLVQRELRFCQRMARAAHMPRFGGFMAVVSRLGNGSFWFGLIFAIACMGGSEGLRVSFSMLLTGLATLAIYKLFKQAIARPRPCELLPNFELREPPLDRWSFPSGHTMHAVSFSVVALSAYPVLAWILVPFTALVMASRVLLGLHYPSDVLAGSLCGFLIGWSFIELL